MQKQPLLSQQDDATQLCIVMLSEEQTCYPPCGVLGGIRDTAAFIALCVRTLIHEPKKAIITCLTHPLFVSILMVGFMGYMSGVMIAFTQEAQRIFYRQHPDIVKGEFTLSDIGFDMFPFTDIFHVADLYMGVVIVICMGVRFFLTKYRLIVLRRFFFLAAIMFVFRIFSFYMTILPDSARTTSTVVMNPFFEGFFIMVGLHFGTPDKIFSGHTMAITMVALFWSHYSGRVPIFNSGLLGLKKTNSFGYPTRPTLGSVYVFIYMTLGCCLFVMLRRHYSIDVFLGFILSFVVFKWYHNYILTACTRDNAFNRFIMWFEQDAPDVPRTVKRLKLSEVREP